MWILKNFFFFCSKGISLLCVYIHMIVLIYVCKDLFLNPAWMQWARQASVFSPCHQMLHEIMMFSRCKIFTHPLFFPICKHDLIFPKNNKGKNKQERLCQEQCIFCWAISPKKEMKNQVCGLYLWTNRAFPPLSNINWLPSKCIFNIDHRNWNRNCVFQFFNCHNGCGTVPEGVILLYCYLY